MDQRGPSMADSIVEVSHIASFELFKLDPSLSVEAAELMLLDRGISVAPVDERLCSRYFSLENPTNSQHPTVDAASTPISLDLVVAGSTPLGDVLEEFVEQRNLFVLNGAWIDGIVCRADLQKPIVGVCMLEAMVALEQCLIEVIRADPDWTELMTDPQAERVKGTFEARAQQKVEIGLEECLTMRDRLGIVGKKSELRERLGFSSKRSFDKFARPIPDLRNVLAHGEDLFASDPDPVQAIRQFVTVRSRILMMIENLGSSQA